jgi:hypothetical protein
MHQIRCTAIVHWGTLVCGVSKLDLWSASISFQTLFCDALSFYITPFSSEVKNEWSYTSVVPIRLNGICGDDFPYIINLVVEYLLMLLWSWIVVSGDEMVGKGELERMWKEVVVAWLKIPARNLPWGTEKCYGILSQGSQWFGWDISHMPSGYESKLKVKNFPTFYGSQRFIVIFMASCLCFEQN